MIAAPNPPPPYPAPSTGAGYATGRATKAQILERASHAFSEQGFHGASLRSIARHAGVDHSTLIHHFGNKTQLLRAVLEWHDGRMIGVIPELPETAHELTTGIVATARYNQDVPGLVQLHSMLLVEAATGGHPAREYMQVRHQALLGILGDTIQSQRDVGAVATNHLSARECAALIISTWDGLQIFDALNPGMINVPTLLQDTLFTAFGLARK